MGLLRVVIFVFSSHAPSHGTREVVIVYGALLSSDPGDIHQTIDHLVEDKIRVSVVGLSAQVAVCRELCKKTNGGDDSLSSPVMSRYSGTNIDKLRMVLLWTTNTSENY